MQVKKVVESSPHNSLSHSLVWMELRSDDVARAKAFYAAMFGWELEENPMGEGGSYVMIKGASAAPQFGAGIIANPAGKTFPSHWTPFFGVDDVVAATKKAESLGGKVAQPPMKSPWGLISTVLDPTGAAFSLWQPEQ